MNYVLPDSVNGVTWYNRPNQSKGDILTDAAALALIGGYDCASHIRACQSPSGRMYRHPDLKAEHEVCCAGNRTCGGHGGTFSRDHTIALCNYTVFSEDKVPLRKFFWYTVRNFGRHSGGTIGQSMQNFNTYASMLLCLGGAYYIFGLLLSLFCLPFLYLSAKNLAVGYRIIMTTEIALLFYMLYPKFLTPLLRPIPRMCYKRQPSNLYYWVCTAIIDGRNPGYLRTMAMKCMWNQHMYGTDDSWLWTDTDDGRKGTGVDVAYIFALISKYNGL